MSHFTVADIHKPDQDIEELLAPYDENKEVEPYIRYTRQEAIDYARRNYKSAEGKTDEECWQMFAEDEQTDEEGNILSTYNPRSTWDWWMVGGRWRGMLRLKDGSTADSARIVDIDFTPDEEAYRRNLRFWDVVVEHQPRQEGEDFFNFYKESYDLKCKDLVSFVYQTCEWKKKLTYRIPGEKCAPDSHAVYFDLSRAMEVHEGRLKEAEW